MKKYLAHSLILMSLAILASCSSVKNIPYLQNADEIDLAASRMLYDAKIMPKDMLTIYINTTDPEAGKPFNLYSQSTTGGNNTIIPYLVDNEGNINFPVLGKLHVAGLTKS